MSEFTDRDFDCITNDPPTWAHTAGMYERGMYEEL